MVWQWWRSPSQYGGSSSPVPRNVELLVLSLAQAIVLPFLFWPSAETMWRTCLQHRSHLLGFSLSPASIKRLNTFLRFWRWCFNVFPCHPGRRSSLTIACQPGSASEMWQVHCRNQKASSLIQRARLGCRMQSSPGRMGPLRLANSH